VTEGSPLCDLKQRTRWYHEEFLFVVLDCESCGGPMWVQRLHGPRQSAVQRAARTRCRRLFGPGVTFTGPGHVPGHYSEHVRGAGQAGAASRDAA